MTTFQTIIIILTAIGLLGSIVGVYIKCRVDIAKIEVHIVNIQRELNQKEFALLSLEKINREDHKEIIKKVDQLILNSR